jgi:hypothetical protein
MEDEVSAEHTTLIKTFLLPSTLSENEVEGVAALILQFIKFSEIKMNTIERSALIGQINTFQIMRRF